jgi:hypothetical protein
MDRHADYGLSSKIKLGLKYFDQSAAAFCRLRQLLSYFLKYPFKRPIKAKEFNSILSMY